MLQMMPWLRSRASRLAQLRGDLSARFNGKRCLVLGSAPGAVAPDLSHIDACICVNGSPWMAARFGIARPDLTVVSGHKTKVRENDVALATLDAWRGLHTQVLLLVEIGDRARHARSVFDKSGFRYETFKSIDQQERAAIIEAVCAKELASSETRVSNGIFAALVAMWAGAREIVFSGFSMEGGHSYMSQDTGRGHQEGDGRFFASAKDLACRVTTTSDELHRLYGLPMAR